MSITFETITRDDLEAMHDITWRNALAALRPMEIEQPVSLVMPYWRAMEAYSTHMGTCAQCVDSPVYEGDCPQGQRLAALAADAMAAQEDLAAQN